ncbi:hypothetical protein [Leisingera sp. NJS204]|uniref:hypothetical protein n=1 Tax=Leisingera sp. NJS204 TaxID=2508307 RepID=UPI001010A184|nr:hypothetical protein [Leisingera sp. NJS204]QAX31317.1 hypothetical protein ETW24_19105 [Leisingera sp. NJS204]
MNEMELLALAAAAKKRRQANAPQPNADGTYGQPPAGTVADPRTGQMVDPDAMRNRVSVSPANAAMHGAGQGLGFGAFDEAVAGTYGALGPGDFQENYDYALARQRAELAANREAHPVVSTGAEVAGGVATALTGLGAAGQAATKSGQFLRSAAAGAAAGGVYGFNSGEGGAAERARAGRNGAAFGTAAGIAARPVGAALASGARRATPALQYLVGRGQHRPAQNALASAMNRSGQDGGQVATALRQASVEGQPQFTVADALGRPGQRMLSGVTRSTPEAAQEVQDYLTQRQAGQGGRVSSFLADAFDAPTTAAQRKTSAQAARGQAANTNYAAARRDAQPVDVRSSLAVIDDRIGGMQGSGVVGDGIDARLAGFRNRLAAASPERSNVGGGSATSVELSDFDRVLGVKQDVQDAIGAAVRAGRNNEARELGKLVSTLDEALETSSTGYRHANNEFAKASRTIDQFDAGAHAAEGRVRPDDVAARYRALAQPNPNGVPAAGLTPQSAFRAGYADPVIARVENSAAGANAARPLTSPKFQQDAATMAVDPDLLARRLGRENRMFETNQTVLGGSRTADNLIDMEDAGRFDTGVFAALLRGRMGEAAGRATEKLAGPVVNRLKGHGPATRGEIAEMLLKTGDDGAATIRQLLTNNQLDQAAKLRLIDQLTAGGGVTSGMAQ